MRESWRCAMPSSWKGRLPAVGWVLAAGLSVSPAAAVPPVSGGRHSLEDARADAYVLAIGDHTTSTNISIEEYSRVRGKRSGDFLWFRRAGKSYWIEDRATLERASALFAPLHALEPEREDLRHKSEALDKKERALDREEEVLDRQMERMDGGDVEDADTEAAAPPEDADREEFQGELDEVRHQQEELQDRQRELEAGNRDLESVERSLDAREDAIEREVEAKLWTLIDGSIEKGLARAAKP